MSSLSTHHDCTLCRVEVRHLTVTAEKNTLLEDVSAHIHCGEVTALIGPNGAGKTTFIRALLGQMPHEGTVKHVTHGGRDIRDVRIGYVPQQLLFDKKMPATVCDLMAACISRRPVWLGVGRSVHKHVADALQVAQAEKLLDRPLGALSGGEMQRVLLAMALMPVPQLLILDEPVSGVDQNGLALFLQTVLSLKKQYHMAILLVSHDWELVRRYADRVILLNRTVLGTGTPDQVFASDEFRAAFPAGHALSGEGNP